MLAGADMFHAFPTLFACLPQPDRAGLRLSPLTDNSTEPGLVDFLGGGGVYFHNQSLFVANDADFPLPGSQKISFKNTRISVREQVYLKTDMQ